MNTMLMRFALLVLLCAPAYAQKKLEVEADTQEGQLLQEIDSEQNGVKKLTLLESFAKQFPNHEAASWVLSNLQTAYLEQKKYDRVFELGTRILSLDTEDVAAAHNCLKAAEARKDVELIRKWSAQASMLAKLVAQIKRPEEAAEIPEWKQKVDYARQVDQYSEYALYFAALQTKDNKIKSSLVETLEQRNPMSEYLAQMRSSPTTVIRQVDIEEAVTAAEASFRRGEYNEDLLMMVTNYYMQKRRETEKILSYSGKLLELLGTKPKPEDMSDADWDRKKRTMSATANWMMGLLYSTQERFALADRHLRTALPNLKNSDMLAGALYHLGYVNFRLAEAGDRIRIHQALEFTKQCISINSAVQMQAMENLKSMKAEYNLP
jgi:hypothetical protein